MVILRATSFLEGHKSDTGGSCSITQEATQGTFGGIGGNYKLGKYNQTSVELNALFFKTLYYWVAVFNFNISSIQAFLISSLF
jgi:hypothetical protein